MISQLAGLFSHSILLLSYTEFGCRFVNDIIHTIYILVELVGQKMQMFDRSDKTDNWMMTAFDSILTAKSYYNGTLGILPFTFKPLYGLCHAKRTLMS